MRNAWSRPLPVRRRPGGPDLRCRRGCSAVLLAGLLIALPAWAEVAELSVEDRSYLERLSLAKARADLLRQVRALRIDDRWTVGDWAGRSVSRDRALSLWVRTQPRHGPTRFYGDATCDVDVRLDPDALARQLEALHTGHPPADDADVRTRDLRLAATRWPILWGAGTAALTERSRSRKPDGWEDVTFEGIESVKRHAEADARCALLEVAAELQVTRARHLREFLDSSEAVRSAVLAGLEQRAEVKVSFALDQVAVAEARISLLDLIRILTDAHQKRYQGELFHAADFRGMALLTAADDIAASGLAFPSSRMIVRAPYATIELDAPAWVAETLTATGRYAPGEEPPPELAVRAEAARLDGIDQLRRQVEQLVIRDGVTVEAFLAEHDELKDDVVLFLAGARVVRGPKLLADDAVEVELELPMRRLWRVVRRGMQRVEVYPPEEVVTQPVDGMP